MKLLFHALQFLSQRRFGGKIVEQVVEPNKVAALLERQTFAAKLFWTLDVIAIGCAPVFVPKRIIANLVHAAVNQAILQMQTPLQVDAEPFAFQAVQERLQVWV